MLLGKVRIQSWIQGLQVLHDLSTFLGYPKELLVIQDSRLIYQERSSGRCCGGDLIIFSSVPVPRYILWEAEEHGLLLPYACRMGCCTACAVRIKEGEMYQPQVCCQPMYP